MRITILSVGVVLMLASSVDAQPVGVSGRIETLSAPQVCAPLATHRIQDTEILLFSPTINLAAVPAIPRKFIGIDRTVSCPVIEVRS